MGRPIEIERIGSGGDITATLIASGVLSVRQLISPLFRDAAGQPASAASMLAARFRADTHVHGASAFSCAADVFGEVGARSLGAGLLLFPLAVPVLAAAIASYRMSQKDIAARSNGQLRHNAANDSLEFDVPLANALVPTPSELIAPPDPMAGGAPGMLPPDIAGIAIKRISARIQRVRIELDVATVPPVAGALTVTPRTVAGGSPPADPWAVPNWQWAYRTCSEQVAAAIVLRVENLRHGLLPFPDNARLPMQVCRVVWTSIDRISPFTSDLPPFDIELRPRGGIGAIPSLAAVPPSDGLDVVVSIPLSRLSESIERSTRAGLGPMFPGIPETTPEAYARFLRSPGVLVIRTSAGRRVIRLPSLLTLSLSDGEGVDAARRVQCQTTQRRTPWAGAYARNVPWVGGGKFGPGPYILVEEALQHVAVRSSMLELPRRSTFHRAMTEKRSVSYVFASPERPGQFVDYLVDVAAVPPAVSSRSGAAQFRLSKV